MAKLISVIIPTYDRAGVTDRAIESVVATEPDQVEIIVVDDGSPQPFCYRKQHPAGIEVRVVRSEINAGAGVARSLGVQAAAGDLIAFLDSDDRFSETWLDALVEAQIGAPVEARGKLVVVGGTEGGKRSHRLIFEFVRNWSPGTRVPLCRTLACFFNPFYTPSIALGKTICRFHPKVRHCEDYYTFALAAQQAAWMVALDTQACSLGRPPRSTGGASSARWKMFRGELRVRMLLLRSPEVRGIYKLLLPFGVLYQVLRTAAQIVLGALPRSPRQRSA